MRLHRFYVEQPLGEVVVIRKVELINQWIKVFRYTKGNQIILFDGKGYDVTYELQDISKNEINLVFISSSPSNIPVKKVFLYFSLIKRDNFELVVQKATELGVTSIVPILSERSEKKHLRLDRLNTIATESAEQCGRGDIPIILDITTLEEAMIIAKNHNSSYVFDTGAQKINSEDIIEKLKNTNEVGLFIGPEGGWSDKEKSIFTDNRIESASFGNFVLRAETAAIVACAYASV